MYSVVRWLLSVSRGSVKTVLKVILNNGPTSFLSHDKGWKAGQPFSVYFMCSDLLTGIDLRSTEAHHCALMYPNFKRLVVIIWVLVL